jgi:hypothetical protein
VGVLFYLVGFSQGEVIMALAKSLETARLRSDLCPVIAIYNQLNAEDKKAFDKAVAAKISTNGLLTALQAEGYVLSWKSTDRHLKNLCKCAK